MASNSTEVGTWWVWATNGTDIQARMGSFSARKWRARRPALEAKTKVPVTASTKASPTAKVRRHVSSTIQYSRSTLRNLLRNLFLTASGGNSRFAGELLNLVRSMAVPDRTQPDSGNETPVAGMNAHGPRCACYSAAFFRSRPWYAASQS